MPQLLRNQISINGENINILIKKSKIGTSWIPLLIALIERLSMAQISAILYTSPRNGEKIINYDDVVGCFESVGGDAVADYGAAETECICGVVILNQYRIYNKAEPGIQYRIGCECIKHWSEEEYVKIEHRKKRLGDPDATFCVNCGRKNNKKSCGCKKQPLNDLTRIIFSAWRFEIRILIERVGKNEKVGFGRFKEMTCYTLLTSKTHQVIRFKNWIMTDPTITGCALSKRIKLQRYQKYIEENEMLNIVM
jgi:hypothetical protein